MKKGSNLLISFILIFVMLIGSTFTSYAAESSTDVIEKLKSLSVMGAKFELQGDISEVNPSYDISLQYLESSSPIYSFALAQKNPSYEDGTFGVISFYFSLSPFTVKYVDINCNAEQIEKQKENLRNRSAYTQSFEGSTIYWTSMSMRISNLLDSSIPVYSIKESPSVYNFETLLKYFNGGGSADSFFKPTPDFSDGSYDSSLDFINLRYKQLGGAPRSHQILWDANKNYDSNTYVTIECDIKWRPFLGALNQVSGWPYIKQSDKLMANSNSFTCLVTEPWKKYFEENDIDWSVFGTQWVDCFYLQVIKYHPDTDNWTRSKVWYVDVGSQTTGAKPIASIDTAEKNPETGEYIKNPGYFVDGDTGEIITGPMNDIFQGFEDAEGIGGYLDSLGKMFITGFKSLYDSIGQFPQFCASVISFLPPSIIVLIGFGIILCIVLRILAR